MNFDQQSFSSPTLKKDQRLNHPVLSFKNKADLEFVFNQIQTNEAAKSILPQNFKSLQSSFDEYKRYKSNNIAKSTSEIVDTTDYLHDMKSYAVRSETEAALLNEDMQIMIADTLFQICRIGIFKVVDEKIQTFLELYESKKDEILFNPSDTSIANEVPLSDGTYQIEEGIYRLPAPIDILNDPIDGGGGGGGYTPPCSTTLPANFHYDTYTVGADFNRQEAINFDDRRFVFETYNSDFLGLGVIRSIGIKGKLQRERKFLWFNYWGESFADEIRVGCDNIDLHTSYVFPTPQTFNNLATPQFNGFFNLTIGNNIVEAIGMNINIKAPLGLGPNITNTQVSNFINSQFNSFANNTFNDNFTPFVNNLIAGVDPSFPVRYANYTKRVNSLTEQNKYRISLANGTKKEGYSHSNTWRFDWNIGAEIIPGPNTTNPTYTYEMKAGSFYGRARVGCKWYGIRIVKQ